MSKRIKLDIENSVPILLRFPALSCFTEEELTELLTMKGYAYVFKYEKEETLILEQTFDCWVFWLLEGLINVNKNNEVIAIIDKPGDIFGEMGPINDDPRSATLTAVTDIRCFGMDLSILDQITSEQRRKFHVKLKEIAIRRMHSANDAVVKAKEELYVEKKKNTDLINFMINKGFGDEVEKLINS